jgi:hypothetical protein
MIKRKPLPGNEGRAKFVRHLAARFLFTVSVPLLLALAVYATPVREYHHRVTQAVKALDALAHSSATESVNAYYARDVDAVRSVRVLLPQNETVELNGTSFKVDNSWLDGELNRYAADNSPLRYELLKRIVERLKAIEERLTELEQPVSGMRGTKEEESRKLAEILRRSEYAHKAQQQNAISRLLDDLIKWIRSWFPKPPPVSARGANIFSLIAQWLVIILALAVLAFVLKLLLPRLMRGRKAKKKEKDTARIVLGERLEPDQSARDLLSEAEALARRGEVRAAIRKAYIALLVELGDRRIISLAQYKTNHDYLRSVRAVEPLYGDVKELTDSFERHWYGLTQATETDWLAFRSAYKQALSR